MILVLSLIVVVCIVFVKWNTDIYGVSGGGCYYEIDYQISIDNEIIISDSIPSKTRQPFGLFNYTNKKMKWGFHKIKTSSNKANVTQTKTIFLLPYQFISIDFVPSNKLLLEFATEDINEFCNKQEILHEDSIFETGKKSFFFVESRWGNVW